MSITGGTSVLIGLRPGRRALFFLKLFLAVVLTIGPTLSALADPGEELAANRRMLAADGQGLAIPSSCIAAPFPIAAPASATVLNEVDDGYGAKFSLAIWRQACANDLYRSVVLVRVIGRSSGQLFDPFLCAVSMSVQQNGSRFTSLKLLSDSGASLCGYFPPGTVKTYVVDQYSYLANFDDQKAFDVYLSTRKLFAVPDYATNFAKFTVTVTTTGAGSGTVASADRRLNCPSLCSAEIEEGFSLVLTATPSSGSRFAGWTDAACGSASPSTVIVTGPLTCGARFEVTSVEPATGFWYDPARSGMGFGIERSGARMMISGYLYRADGTPLWFIAAGNYDGLAMTAPMQTFQGGPMLGGDAKAGMTLVPNGTVNLRFTGPTRGMITWDGLATPIMLERFAFGDAPAADQAGRNPAPAPATRTARPPRTAGTSQPRVIVTLRGDGDRARQAGAVRGRMAQLGAREVHALQTAPQLVVDVTPEAIAALRADPDVVQVEEDQLLSLSLRQSGPLIQAALMHQAGLTGTGRAVAVLDTGVDATHPFLAGRVIAEACFSTNFASSSETVYSACPNGQSSQIGAGAARPCPLEDCDHGTHVAGIAAGSGGDIAGVAPGASIVALQIGVMIKDADCPTRCWAAYTSDILRGLDWVNQQASVLGIAAINMSLGGGAYTSACDSSSLKPTIDALRAKGIATVVASGNDGEDFRISLPACISSTVAVGATTKADTVSTFSNTWSRPMLMAPGSAITSSVPGGGFASYSGTSMATPHVAGAFALLKAMAPNATVTETFDQLAATGQAVTDGYRSYKRINVRDAGVALGGGINQIVAQSGWWWTPTASGRGYFIETRGENIFLASYHYLASGPADWAIGQGRIGPDKQIHLDLRRFAGGTSFDGVAHAPTETTGLGAVTIQFTDTRSGVIILPNGQRQMLVRFPI